MVLGRRWQRLPPVTDAPAFVIGDVHGCLKELVALLLHAPDDATLICVGDIIDRGPSSAAVIDLMMERPDITCLMGNHELMCLAFLDARTPRSDRWMKYGGRQTLASFGLTGNDPDELRPAFIDALGPDRIAWLRARPYWHQVGNVAIVHAGADPALPMDAQDPQTLAWGHPDFGSKPRMDDLWILHGHTIVTEPISANGIISVDTGAYTTGMLTAAHITADGCSFITV